MTDTAQVKEITSKLEQGVKDLFTSERYADYLKTMSRFHKYSTRNTLLIHMQKPDATLVAGFNSWQTKFGRSVKKGEKSIKILAPVPFVKREEKEKLDPDTRQPIIGDDGMPVVEFTERQLARFKVTSVFDVSQTAGKELPTLAQDLIGNVEQYKAFMDALRAVSPLPIVFEEMPQNQDGTCRFGKEIAIRAGMSEIQTVCAVIHEMTHAKLHDKSLVVDADGNAAPKDRRTEEVEAESVSFSVLAFFGIETGANSFGYIAEWSKGRELKELNVSLDTIRKTAAELIESIDGKFKEILKDRDITLAIGEAQVETSANTQDAQDIPPASETTVSTELSANEVYAKYANIVADRAAAYAVSSGTLLYTDEAAARRACDQIVQRVVADLLLEPGERDAGEHYPLFKQYTDDPDFKARLEDYIFIKAYLEPKKAIQEALCAAGTPMETSASANAPANTRQEQTIATIETKLYDKFAELFPDVESEQYSYLRLEAGAGFMPLSLEWIGDNQLSVMHTYMLNGDLCYDPMIVFAIDKAAGTMTAVEYEQSIPPLYQRMDEDGNGQSIDGNGNEKTIRGLQGQINDFAAQWLNNIGEQGYMPVKANMEIDGEYTQITFDADGNPIQLKTEKEYDLGYGFLGNGVTVWNRAEEKDGDYTTVAHISTERAVTFYDKDMPEDVREKIEAVAQSLDTWAFGFKPLPVMIKQSADKDTPVNSNPESYPSEPELMMPDPSIGYSEMNLYGYTADDMYPLTAARAVELFDTNHTIYLLYPDNTEAMAFDRDEIITFSSDGLCGITHADWELSPVRAAREAEAKTLEASREAELLYGSGNRFGIYQIRDDIKENRDYRFASLEELQALNLDVERGRYELIYTAPFSDRIEFLTDRQPVLNRLFEEFNVNLPADYKGSSVSVSDVIVLKYNGSDVSSHYVDRMGFVEIDHFVGNEKTQSPMQPEAAVQAVAKETPAAYSQVGNRAEEKRPDAPKGRLTLAERLAENKLKAKRQRQPDVQKYKERETMTAHKSKLQGVRE